LLVETGKGEHGFGKEQKAPNGIYGEQKELGRRPEKQSDRSPNRQAADQEEQKEKDERCKSPVYDYPPGSQDQFQGIKQPDSRQDQQDQENRDIEKDRDRPG